MQSADYVYLGKERGFVLIDVEIGKQMITCGDFNFLKPDDVIEHWTSNYRGYTAKYYVVRKELYCVKMHDILTYDKNLYRKVKSPKVRIPYTGSCIIARKDSFFCSDFLHTYLYFDEAFELYFIDGVLKEKLSLSSAIDEFKKIENNEKQIQSRDTISRKYLKYRYDFSTYKWRDNEIW